MNEPMNDETFDRQLRAFLSQQAEEVHGAPSAAEMAARISPAPVTSLRGWPLTPQLSWVLIVILLAVALIGGAAAGALLLRDGRLPLNVIAPPRASNGWIAFSTQPGYVQVFGTDRTQGSDIYLAREGSDARIVVARGTDMKRNVCPQFSPDGNHLVYGELAGSAASLVVLAVSVDGTVTRTRDVQLPEPATSAPCPLWSREGTHIAYLDSTTSSVVVVDPDGLRVPTTDQDPLASQFNTRDPMGVDDPAELVSPDGTLRALCRDGVGLVVGPLDGSADRVLFPGCGYSLTTWSPDGTAVLYMSDGGLIFAVMMRSILNPPSWTEQLIARAPLNGGRSFPGRGDVSWQPVYE